MQELIEFYFKMIVQKSKNSYIIEIVKWADN